MADVRWMPVPVTENWDWQLRAACRSVDSSVFFHPERERGAQKEQRDTQAKKICRSCPVLEQCRRHALATHEPYGVWGGLTAAERTVYRSGGSGVDTDARVTKPHTTPSTARLAEGEFDIEPRRACRRLHRTRLDTPPSLP
jgi:WhiB family redox-sensing transcriptional regulator